MRKIITTVFVCLITLPGEGFSQPVPFLEDLLRPFPNVRDLTMSATEAYFTAQSPLGEVSVIMVSHKQRNSWRKPVIASFSGQHSDLEPFLSTDGRRLYFASNRPVSKDSTLMKNYDLWMVSRDHLKDEWSTPVNLGPTVNTMSNEFYPAVSARGNLYFTSDRPGSLGKDDLYVSVWMDEAYQTPRALSESINTEGYEFNAFIAPDESFLIFSGYNRTDGLGSADLYISYQQENSTWTPAINLGAEINSKSMDYCPWVNVSTNTLYYTSRRSQVAFNDGGFKQTKTLLQALNQHSNGQSRLYQIPFKDGKLVK